MQQSTAALGDGDVVATAETPKRCGPLAGSWRGPMSPAMIQESLYSTLSSFQWLTMAPPAKPVPCLPSVCSSAVTITTTPYSNPNYSRRWNAPVGVQPHPLGVICSLMEPHTQISSGSPSPIRRPHPPAASPCKGVGSDSKRVTLALSCLAIHVVGLLIPEQNQFP